MGGSFEPHSPAPPQLRVSERDMAGRGEPTPEWEAHFDPAPKPIDPEFDSIDAAQAWARDLTEFERTESRRYKTDALLKGMIERLPPEVWLPDRNVIDRFAEKDGFGSKLTVTSTSEPIDTAALRNKLYTRYLTVDRPSELAKPRDATGLIWDDELSPTEAGGIADYQPFLLDRGGFTPRELAVLEFLFADEMLDWRRRDIMVQRSVEKERWRRGAEVTAATAGAAKKFIGVALAGSAIAGISLAVVPVAEGAIAARLGIGPGALSQASFLTRLSVRTLASTVVSAGGGATNTAIVNAPALASGDISIGEYFGSIAEGTRGGAKWGAIGGAAGSLLGDAVTKVRGFLSGTAEVAPQGPARVGWVKWQAQKILTATTIGVRDAVPAARGGSAATIEAPIAARIASREAGAGGAPASVKPSATTPDLPDPAPPIRPAASPVAEAPVVQAPTPAPVAATQLPRPAVTKPATAAEDAAPQQAPQQAPQNEADFSDVGADVGTEVPGTVQVSRSRNSYPGFETTAADDALLQARTARLSGQVGIPIPADRVLVAPWIGRIRNRAGEMRSVGTSQGWLRNDRAYWNAFRTQFPEDFALIGPGRTVTPELAARWGWPPQTVGQRLIHHHIDNGTLVVALPEGMHHGASGSIHATVRIEGRP